MCDSTWPLRQRLLCLVLLILLGCLFSSCEKVRASEPETIVKTFSQMTTEDKERVLVGLKSDGIVLDAINVGGGTYLLNEALWYERGLITYGDTATVNTLVQTTASPNYKNGLYRYWGFDLNGGLYGNDDFPRDSDTGTLPWTKDWLTIDEVRINATARGYVGNFTMTATFDEADKQATASEFLEQNPQWETAGYTVNTILEHFYFNAVVSDSGLTQGQFIGVHLSRYDGKLYYQTFSLEVSYLEYVIPQEIIPEPEEEDPVIEPEPSVGAECILGLPSTSFEGHPVAAEDSSLYLVEGEIWSARRTLEENLTENRFTVPGNSEARVRRLTMTMAEILFNREGFHEVELRIKPAGGSYLYDRKTIEILPTPSISHTLTGTQKENRKQVLNLQVATHPDHPLVEYKVELIHEETEEAVTLFHYMGKQENELANGDTIKTRPIEALPSDPYFQNCRLEFLTKNSLPTDYRYIVTVEDDRGNRDQVSVVFPVMPDLPPSTQILMDSYFLRGPDSDLAYISASDGTATDGDQLDRSWFLQGEEGFMPLTDLPGYVDESFGTRTKVGFLKFGVGTFRLRLDETEIWTEETLEEYVTPEDRRSGTAEAEAEVINVAPVVSMSPIARKSAEILLLAGGENAYRRLESNKSLLDQELRADGIDGTITIARISPEKELVSVKPSTLLMQANTPFGYNGASTFYENANFLVDERRLFKIDATWIGATQNHYPTAPYKISCFEAADNQLLWTFSFGEELLSVPSTGSYLAQDDEGVYLFLVAGGKTMVIEKETGTFLTLLAGSVGRENFSAKQRIYTLKSDGIYRISTGTGEMKRIFSGKIEGSARRIGNKIHFLTSDGLSLFRAVFDTEAELLAFERLSGNERDDGQTTYRLAGIDIEGTMIVEGKCPSGSGYIQTVRAYDRNNLLVFQTTLNSTSSHLYTFTPVFDEGGVCNYLAATWDRKSSSTYRASARVYGIRSSYVGETSVTDTNGYPTESTHVIFAREIAGKPYVVTGAYWTYILYTGSYGNGPVHGYPERTKVFVFDPAKGTVSMGSVNDLGMGIVTREYGLSSDALAAVQTGNNHVGLTNGNETLVLAWKQSPKQILDRYLAKYFAGSADLNMVVLLDETTEGMFAAEPIVSALSSSLPAKNGSFFLTDAGTVEADGEGGLGEQLLGREVRGRNTLAVSVDENQEGVIDRTVRLDPNTVYYYEYEIKTESEEPADLFCVEFDVKSSVAEQMLLHGGYTVTGSFFEDFNDGQRSFFFGLQDSRISDGVYKGGNVYNRQGSDWSNRYYQDSSSLTFTIPQGEQGILSFDYKVLMDGEQMWMANFIKINGKEWEAFVPASGSGHYTHPVMLPPGETTLTFYARAYGGRTTEARTWVDNLRLDLVSPVDDETNAGKNKYFASGESTGLFESRSGYRTVSGSFRTPPAATAYRPQAGAIVLGGPIGASPYTRWTSTEAGRKSFVYEIPAGKTAVYTLVSTASSPRIYKDNYYGSTYSHGEYSWTSYSANRYPQSAMSNIPTDYRIRFPSLTGTKTFSQRSSDYRGAYGDFIRIDSVLVDAANNLTNEGRFVIHDGQLLLEAENFQDQGEVSFHLAEGTHLIRNLRIYSIHNGIKVYALDERFTDSSEIQNWTFENAAGAVVITEEEKEETPAMVYQKGELMDVSISYFDYEGDPSKKEFYRYTHTPFNDGPHPLAAVVLKEDGEPLEIRDIVLGEPITKFYNDGKYTLEHWQEDNTERPPTENGNPEYDKASNVETLTFYIVGSASAPWIESIRTDPAKVKEGEEYQLRIRVDDLEKDVLRLRTELYREGNLIFSKNNIGLEADPTGNYPEVQIDGLPIATPGIYEVVCTVRDDTGVGLGSYRFPVISLGRITGWVFHTEHWEENRKRFNLLRFGREANQPVPFSEYIQTSPPRLRGSNVFWSGERFELSAAVAGDPIEVEVLIDIDDSYKATLHDSGKRNPAGEKIYEGYLWDSSMQYQWGRPDPDEIPFRFIARYPGEVELTYETSVIVDSFTDYWLLHRLW